MGYICQQDRKRKTNNRLWLIQENTMKKTLCIVAFGAFGLEASSIRFKLHMLCPIPQAFIWLQIQFARMVAPFNQVTADGL